MSIDAHAQQLPAKAFTPYTKRGRPAQFDPVRGFLVEMTPEEVVRQSVVRLLHVACEVPLEAVHIECPVRRFGGRTRGRSDIVVASGGRALLVIECKEPGTVLHDGVFAQAASYAAEIGAPLLALTNGTSIDARIRRGPRWCVLDTLPSFEEMHAPLALPFSLPPSRHFARLSFHELTDHDVLCEHDEMLARAWDFRVLGADTPRRLWTPIYLLYHAIFHAPELTSAWPSARGFRVVRRMGTHFTEYGNASGGRYPGLYASFLVDDGSGDDRVFKIGFFACARTHGDPTFGNRRSTSGLHVCVDDPDGGHAALQLSLDTNLRVLADRAEVVHDGRITVGRSGRAPNDAVLEFVARVAPHLVRGRSIKLGSFRTDLVPTFDDVASIVVNLLQYAHARELFRAVARAAGRRR